MKANLIKYLRKINKKAFSIYYHQGKNWVRLDPKEETTTSCMTHI